MNGIRRVAFWALIALASLGASGGFLLDARAQDAGAKQPYTIQEYNAYQAACTEKNSAQQISLLDGFVKQYPTSALSGYIYQCYSTYYGAQKNSAKVIEYADKLVALGVGDKADVGMHYAALLARAYAFNALNLKDSDPTAKDQAIKARDAALLGLKTLDQIKKPDNLSEEDFKKQKLQPLIVFNYTAASAARMAKDFKGAVDSYKATLILTPNEPATWSQLGISYLSLNPPQHLDGFWTLAHAVSLKGPAEGQVKGYLRRQMLAYQQLQCENLLDAELSELVALAGSSADRPTSYTLPTSAELEAARTNMTIASVIADLKAGGDKSKVTWLSSCGLEFPDVPSKLLNVAADSDDVVLKVAFVSTEAEFDAATTPDMEVKVAGQPDAGRLVKDNPVRFTGTLASYDPSPAFLLHWEKAKVNPEDIPEDKKKPPVKKPPVRHPAAKKPGN